MYILDKTSGLVYLDDQYVSAAVYCLIGRRDSPKLPGDMDVLGDVMYIGYTAGREFRDSNSSEL